MDALVLTGLANAVSAAALALLALAAGRFGRRPALAHCLWLLVLVQLVTPPLFELPVAHLPAPPRRPPRRARPPAPPPLPPPSPPPRRNGWSGWRRAPRGMLPRKTGPWGRRGGGRGGSRSGR